VGGLQPKVRLVLTIYHQWHKKKSIQKDINVLQAKIV
jgi:hypothetical protein